MRPECGGRGDKGGGAADGEGGHQRSRTAGPPFGRSYRESLHGYLPVKAGDRDVARHGGAGERREVSLRRWHQLYLSVGECGVCGV